MQTGGCVPAPSPDAITDALRCAVAAAALPGAPQGAPFRKAGAARHVAARANATLGQAVLKRNSTVRGFNALPLHVAVAHTPQRSPHPVPCLRDPTPAFHPAPSVRVLPCAILRRSDQDAHSLRGPDREHQTEG